jgi:DNA-binding transcriptional ArsR family regulator
MAAKDSAVGLADMNIDWTDFLRKKVNSFIKWDLVRFFHDNPHVADTADNIARYIGRDPRALTHELSGLVEVGVLQAEEVSGVEIYRLTKDQATRDVIAKFVEACHDREFRVKAIYNVIHGMEFSPRHDF